MTYDSFLYLFVPMAGYQEGVRGVATEMPNMARRGCSVEQKAAVPFWELSMRKATDLGVEPVVYWPKRQRGDRTKAQGRRLAGRVRS